MTEVSRRQRTILLLETRTAWHPSIRSQFATFGALPGEKATKRVTCALCKGEGTTPSRTGPVPCERCNAHGTYLVDAYTGYRSRDEGDWKGTATITAVEKRRQSDATIARMASQTAPPKSEQELIEEANQNPDPWEKARAAHYDHGSYEALTLALEWLGGRAPGLRQLVQWIYEDGLIAPGPETATRAVMAVDAVAERLPDPIRVPPWIMPAHPAQDRIARRKIKEAA